jgi:hypothetical protein
MSNWPPPSPLPSSPAFSPVPAPLSSTLAAGAELWNPLNAAALSALPSSLRSFFPEHEEEPTDENALAFSLMVALVTLTISRFRGSGGQTGASTSSAASGVIGGLTSPLSTLTKHTKNNEMRQTQIQELDAMEGDDSDESCSGSSLRPGFEEERLERGLASTDRVLTRGTNSLW